MMRVFLIFFFFVVMLFAESHKVYYYTSEKNIENFKKLKIDFDKYLSQYGEYEFQPFSDKKTLEKYLKNKKAAVMLSSWHYVQISDAYDLEAVLVAQERKSISQTNVIVGRKNIPLRGTLTTAFSPNYTKNLIRNTFGNAPLRLLKVPKDIDALMAVGYGMSQFASVAKSSFLSLKKINSAMTDNMRIYNESDPAFRMIIAFEKDQSVHSDFMQILMKMHQNSRGRRILEQLGIDRLIRLSSKDLSELRSMK